MATDVRLRLWRLLFRTKQPPPQWQRDRRGPIEYIGEKLGRKKKRAKQSLSLHDS